MLYRESSLNVIDIAYVCDLEYVLAYWILSLSLSLSTLYRDWYFDL